MPTDHTHAQCPECLEWSPVAWDGELPPGGWWWKDSGGCPRCGETICVESECIFGHVVRELGAGHVVVQSGPGCEVDRLGRLSGLPGRGVVVGDHCMACNTVRALVSTEALHA